MLEKDTTSQEAPYIIFTGVDKEKFPRDFGERGNHYDSYTIFEFGTGRYDIDMEDSSDRYNQVLT
jgi:hypothetical protein